jgi:hypothetical protein
LEPLDAIWFTSERNGYMAEVFEVVDVEDRTDTLLQFITVRKRDAGDVAWTLEDDLPDVPSRTGLTPPDPTVPVITVAPLALPDGSGDGRRPGIRLTWDTTTAPEAQLLRFDVKLSGGNESITSGTVAAEEGSTAIAGDLLPGEDYQVRARFVLGRRTDWSAWMPVTTPDVRLDKSDLESPLVSEIDTALARHDDALADATGTVAELRDAASAAYGPLDAAESLDDRVTAAMDRHDDALADATGTVGELLASVTAHLGSIGITPAPGVPAVVQPVDGALIDRVLPMIPAQRDVEARLDEASQQIGWALSNIQRTDQRMADAGITVDPESGQVKISAVEYLDQRASDLSIDLDAAKASIELRATYADVNQAITEAKLDPESLPALDDLQADVSSVKIDVSALESSIVLKADNTRVDGIETTTTNNGIAIGEIQDTIELKADKTTLDEAEERISTAETQLSVLDGASLRQTVRDAREQFDAIDATLFDTLGEAWRAFESREALREGFAFGQSEINAKVNEGLDAEASARQALAVAVDEANAGVERLDRVKVDADGAVSSINEVVEAEFDGLTTFAEFSQWAIANESGANAGFRFALDGNNVLSAAKVTPQGDEDPSTDVRIGGSTITLDGDTTVASDFTVLGENITLDGNTTVTGTFVVTGEYIVLDSATAITNDFVLTGGNVRLDAGTLVEPDFSVSGFNITLDGDTTVTGDFTVGTANIDTLAVTRDLLAPGVITEVQNYVRPESSPSMGVSGGQATRYFAPPGIPGEFGWGNIQGIITAVIRGRGTSTSGPGGSSPFFGGHFRVVLEIDGATFTSVHGAIIDGEMQCRQSAWRGASAGVTSWRMRVDVWDVPDGDVEILNWGFILSEIYR